MFCETLLSLFYFTCVSYLCFFSSYKFRENFQEEKTIKRAGCSLDLASLFWVGPFSLLKPISPTLGIFLACTARIRAMPRWESWQWDDSHASTTPF
jgi:hypothetical protein